MNAASPWRSVFLAPWQHGQEPEERAAVRLGPRPEPLPLPLGALPLDAATLARWQEWRASTQTRREALVRTGQLAPAQAAALARLEANRESAGSAAEPGWAAAVLAGLHVPEGRDGKRTLALLADACGGRQVDLLGPVRLAAVETALTRYLRPLWQAAREAQVPVESPWREERPAAETEPAATGEEREESEMMAGAVTERPVKRWPCGRETMARIAEQVARRGGFGLPKSEREDAARAVGLTSATFDTSYYALRRDPDGYAALLGETEPAPPTERPEHVPLPEEPAPVVEPEAAAMNPCGHPVATVVTGAEGTQYCGACESEVRELASLTSSNREELASWDPTVDQLRLARADRDTWREAHHLRARERDELRERVTELEHEVEKLGEERDRLQQRVAELLHAPAAPAYRPHEHVYTLTGRELRMAYDIACVVADALVDHHQTHEVPAAVWRAAGEMLVLVDDGEGEGGAS